MNNVNNMKKLAIIYCRVSSKEQGDSRNGLEAQRSDCVAFAAANGFDVVEVVEEVVSGGYGMELRPVLKMAVEKCNKMGATLLVSRLCRLSRHALFIFKLMETKLKFCVAALGVNTNEFTLHIHAVVAEQERKLIGQRTKEALAQLKLKGVVLGNRSSLKEAAQRGRDTNVLMADKFAEHMKPTVQRMLNAGMSYRAIAREFNAQGNKTVRGGEWSAATISNIVKRL